ncbi:MAG: hypothetical protein KKD38_00465, partial [Candidatus Delongbacteria bacterium]|nr:hypothetical protein [Candidatus Delongbacteria bacterium]
MKNIFLLTGIVLSVIILFLACSEERDHASPFDPEYWNDEIPTLTDFNLQNIAIDTIKLSWTNTNELPERYSYRIDKKVGDNNWIENYKIVASNESDYKDYAELDKVISYRACIIYDKNKSSTLEESIDNPFSPPSDLIVT